MTTSILGLENSPSILFMYLYFQSVRSIWLP
jgi:hypothetical protein